MVATNGETNDSILREIEKKQAELTKQKEQAMAKLEGEFAITREDLLRDEKLTVSRQHDVARELEKVAAELVAKQTRLESILRGLATARELDVPANNG